jgi:hypothetical protein
MAIQQQHLKLIGRLGDLSFYKNGDQYLVRSAHGISRERFQKDPAFRKSRENASEFGRAANGVKLIRNAFAYALAQADSCMSGRLTRCLLRVIQADPFHPRGLRTIDHGAIHFLNGFDFNEKTKSSGLLHSFHTFPHTSQRAYTVTCDPFIPHHHVVAPSTATHFQLIIVYTTLDFTSSAFKTEHHITEAVLCKMKAPMPFSHTFSIPKNATGYLLVGVGIRFLTAMPREFVSLHAKEHSGFRIINTFPLDEHSAK